MQVGWIKIGEFRQIASVISRKRYKIDALKSNRKSYALYRMITLPMTFTDPEPPQTNQFSAFCTPIHSFVTSAPRDFKFGRLYEYLYFALHGSTIKHAISNIQYKYIR